MLRYAGGKSRAIKTLEPYVPPGDVVSPFLGGGSFELHLAKTRTVYASDCFEPLVAFWTAMKTDRESLVTELKSLHPFTKETYKTFQKTLNEPGNQAVKFFVVNRCCFSGCITGGYSGARAPMSCIDALTKPDLTNLEIACRDYEAQLALYPTMFAFLDPPYDVPNLYGSPAFDHERLARVLRERKSGWMLCYNDTPRIRALYQDWCRIDAVSWAYGMNASRKSNEIVITPQIT